MAGLPRVIVLTTEPPPLPGMATTGAGLRAWALAQGLRCAGHEDVTLMVAADAFSRREGKVPPVPAGCPRVQAVPRRELSARIEAEHPDLVVAQHWGLLREAMPIACPLAVDLAGPHLLERRYWGSADPAADRREKLEALARADYVVCSGPAQRRYFIPFLLDAGFEPDAELCPVIPYSLSPDLPTPAADRDMAAFVFSGYFLPWQDPEQPLRMLLEEFDARGRGSLEFFGGMHPTLDVSRGRFEGLLDLLENHPRVHRHGVVSFDELVVTLRRCGVALDLLPRNLERELAFPSRTVMYLWAGIPVIHNRYDDLAPWIEEHKAGWTLEAGDGPELRRLVGRLLGHREDIERRSAAAIELVRRQFTWDKTIEPLARWTRDPHPRPNRRTRPAAVTVAASPVSTDSAPSAAGGDPERLREENARLRAELKTLRAAKVVQIESRARELSPLAAPFVFLLTAVFAALLFMLFLLADGMARLSGQRTRIGPPRTSARSGSERPRGGDIR